MSFWNVIFFPKFKKNNYVVNFCDKCTSATYMLHLVVLLVFSVMWPKGNGTYRLLQVCIVYFTCPLIVENTCVWKDVKHKKSTILFLYNRLSTVDKCSSYVFPRIFANNIFSLPDLLLQSHTFTDFSVHPRGPEKSVWPGYTSDIPGFPAGERSCLCEF